ncbi:MAG: hypothetical protein IKG11_00515 [Atopobiaceae bacterium]|nr:hypothetical protein [Atopobiaceae bacterium]
MSSYSYESDGAGRSVVSYIFSFFLSLLLVALVALLVLELGVLPKTSFLSFFDSNYYGYLLNDINDQTRYYTTPTGINASVLEGVFTQDKVKVDSQGYVKAAFDGTTYEPDLTSMREKLTQNVLDSFAADGVEETDETRQIATSYVDEIMGIYTKEVQLPGLSTIAQYRSKVLTWAIAGTVGVALLCVLLAVLISRLHDYLYRAMRYYAYATGGAALMSFIVPCALYVSKFYAGLGLAPQYFYHFGITVIERILIYCMIGGAVLLVVTVILIAASTRMRKKVVGDTSRHRHMKTNG